MTRVRKYCMAVLSSSYLLCAQSSIVFDAGASVEVTSGADICADEISLDGAYSGEGTKCEEALPVELVSFTAVVKNRAVELRWHTATEQNNHGFNVERMFTPAYRTDNGSGAGAPQWETIVFIPGRGTTNAPQEYSFDDRDLAAGTYRYRLQQIDLDGTFSYSSHAEAVIVRQPVTFALVQNFPNPFNPKTTIEFSVPYAGPVTLKVYNTLGREVARLFDRSLEAGEIFRAEWDATGMPSGAYWYRLETPAASLVKRMVLLK